MFLCISCYILPLETKKDNHLSSTNIEGQAKVSVNGKFQDVTLEFAVVVSDCNLIDHSATN